MHGCGDRGPSNQIGETSFMRSVSLSVRRTRSRATAAWSIEDVQLLRRCGAVVLAVVLGSTTFGVQAQQRSTAGTLEINACELLSSAEISSAIGVAVDGGRRQDEGPQADGSYSSSCIWMIEPQKKRDPAARLGGRRFVILNAVQWPQGRNLAGKFLQAFRDAAEQGVIPSKPAPRKFGDEALWWGDGLAVRKGDVSFGVSVFMPSEEAPRTSALEEKLAPIILRRIDEQ
jgi:hypothetical protein